MSYIKHIFTFAASALVTLMLGACSDDVDMPSPEINPGDGYITISLSNARAGSRATEADVDALNENKIESVILALYPNNNVEGKPVYLQTFDFTATNTTAELKVQLTNALRDRLFPGGVNSTCQAYVIVNKPATSPAITEDMTITEMQQIAVSADFADKRGQNSFVMDGSTANITYQKSGNREWASGTIDVRRVASKITLAAQVANEVEVDGVKWTCDPSNMTVVIKNGVKNSRLNPTDYVPAAGDYYNTSTSDNNENYRQRGFKSVSGDFPFELESPFYSFPNSWDAEAADNRQTYMTLMVPWKKDGENSYQTCYYTVPVTKGNTIGRNISYRVKINVNMLGSFTPDEPVMLPNLSYYAVEWGSVGFDVDINEIRYLVVDQNAFTMNNEQLLNIPVYTSHPIKIKKIKLTYFRYNLTARGVETGITITEAQAKKTADDGYGNIYTCEPKTNPDGSTYVAYDHAMKIWTPYRNNNEVSLTGYGTDTQATTNINGITNYRLPANPQDEFSRYIAEITIVHADKVGEKDEALYTETLTITQYPQIYITSTENFYYHQPENPVNPTYGNMFCNGNNTETTGSDWDSYEEEWKTIYYWFAAAGLYTNNPTSTNANSNQYVINITQLNDKTDYIIGDPRMNSSTNMIGWTTRGIKTGGSNRRPQISTIAFGSNSQYATVANGLNWKVAEALYDNTTGGRKLKYYYRSDSSKTKERWIAPSFRIASSYGVCWPLTYREAQLRCAGYQELGYPAGRWRIPTVAEIEYIMKLSQEEKIPTLFNTNSEYMSAQGVVKTSFNGEGKLSKPNISGTSAVRCVYDEWYWNDVITTNQTQTAPDGTSIKKYPFKWGDRPR